MIFTFKFRCEMRILLVVTSTFTKTAAIDRVCHRSLSERTTQASAGSQRQPVIATAVDMVSAWRKAVGHSWHVFMQGKNLARAAVALCQDPF